MNDSPHPSRDTDFQYVAQILVPDALVGGRYRLVEPLGRGGYSIVWRAHDEHLNMDVAIKFLSDLIVNNHEALGDLKRETRLSLQLTHPNIVRIYGFVQEEHVAGISMEFVDGGTLAELKSANTARAFQPNDLKSMLRPLFDALQYAHEVVQVVHRDLKPANLMVDSKGLLRIADFGISSSLNDTRTRDTAQVSGTVAYMSPEQIAGRPASITDDIYSLGATLFDLFAGKPPFYRGNVIGQVVSVEPPTIQARRKELGIELDPVPDVWEKTIHSCLAKEASRRPQTIREMAERLGLYDVTISGGGPPVYGTELARASKPGVIGMAIAGGVAAALVAGSLIFYFSTRDQSAIPISVQTPAPTPSTRSDVAEEDVSAAPPERSEDLTPGLETPMDTPLENAIAASEMPSVDADGADEGEADAGAPDARETATSEEAPAGGAAAVVVADALPDPRTLRSEIEVLIAGREWEGAMETIEALVDAAPGEITLAHQLTQQLGEAKEVEAHEIRVQALRTEIRGLADAGSLIAAGDLINELDVLAPGDPEVRAWKSERVEARAASLEAASGSGEKGAAKPEEKAAASPAEDEEAIRAVLASYESAMEALDVPKYASLWASMSGSERSKVDRAFQDLKAQSVEISGMSIALNGASATLQFHQKQTMQMKFGSDPPPVDRTRSMKMVRSSDGKWLIDSIQ